jgi:hypothetical protein
MATLPGAGRYPAKTGRVMIFVLRHQVKTKVVAKIRKTFGKSVKSNRKTAQWN